MPPSRIPAQVFVRGLDGRSRCVDLPGDASRSVSLGRLSRALARAPWGAPEAELLVACGARVYAPAREPGARLPAGSACTLLLRVAGGKGGFGSLLRGAGTSGAATTNQDACRDLSGRRIRHVEAERKIREHARTQPQRDLERLALAHIKAKETGAKRKFAKIEEEEKERYARDSGAVVDGVAASVRAGIAAAADAKGKKPATFSFEDGASTRRRAYVGDPLARGGVSDDSDDSDGGDDGGSDADAARETNGRVFLSAEKKKKQGSRTSADVGEKNERVGVSFPEPPALEARAPCDAASPGSSPAFQTTAATSAAGLKSEDASEWKSPLDLSSFADAAALEAAGLDFLKRELQERGLKCGGTLAQRAERLFLLRDASLEALDAKHKAPKRATV